MAASPSNPDQKTLTPRVLSLNRSSGPSLSLTLTRIIKVSPMFEKYTTFEGLCNSPVPVTVRDTVISYIYVCKLDKLFQ